MRRQKFEKFLKTRGKKVNTKKGAGARASSISKKRDYRPSPVHRRSKLTDSRYTQNSTYEELNKRSRMRTRWQDAYDPMVGETRAGGQQDAMLKDWGKESSIFLNPPFSNSQRFLKKLVGTMEQSETLNDAMVLLPWYQVEDQVENRTRSYKPKWHHNLDPAMKELNKREHKLGNQPFWDPHNKKMVHVRVYGVELSK